MDDIRTAGVGTSSARAAARGFVTYHHVPASMSNSSTIAAFPAIEASKPVTKRDGYTPTRNWHPARRPPGTT